MVFFFRMYYGVYFSQSKFLIVGTSKLCIFFLFPLHCVTAGSHGTQAFLYSTVILSVLAIIQIVINLCLSLYFTTGTWLFSEQKIMPVFCCFVIFFFYCMNSHDSLVFSHIIIVNLPFEKLNNSYFHFLNTCLRSIGYFFFQTNRNIPGSSIQLTIKSNDIAKHDLFPINIGYM